MGILSRKKEAYGEAINYLKQSLLITDSFDDPDPKIAALNNISLVYSDKGDVIKAIETCRKALELCIHKGDRHKEAALYNNLADYHHKIGEYDKSMQFLKQAVVIFTAIGVEDGTRNPEIWKLLEW